MPSRCKATDVLPRSITHLDVKGNAFAITYAKEAAALVKDPSQVSSDRIQYSLLANKDNPKVNCSYCAKLAC